MVLVVPGAQDELRQEGSLRVYSVASAPSPFNSRYRLIRPNAWPGVNRRVVEILRAEAPALIEIADKYSLHYLAGLIRKGWLDVGCRPILLGLSCERLDDNFQSYVGRHPLGMAFVRRYMKWNYFGYFDHHVTVSHHTADELIRAGRGHAVPRGIFVRGMGVDLAAFDPAKRSERLRQELLRGSGAQHLVLYAGRLVPEKNLQLLFSTADLLAPNCRLVVAGEGMERARWESKYGASVSFCGHIADRESLARLYASCDVFLHPNPREPFGIAPLEAMTSGLPLVAPDEGGITTYANERNAWLAPPEPRAFAAAVRLALQSSERWQKIQEALATAAQFSWSSAAGRYFDLYDRLIAGGPANEADFQSSPGNWLGWET
jgi:glycosyltransferase involved in cell wall biosynthesis